MSLVKQPRSWQELKNGFLALEFHGFQIAKRASGISSTEETPIKIIKK